MPTQPVCCCHTRFHLTLRHLVILTTALALTTLSTTASAAPGQRSVAVQQLDPADPIVVVENFLAARNARDPFGATYFSAPLLVIHDGGGQWIADEPATRQWLRQFTDAYVVDMLVKPHATGDTIAWVERLADRGLPYRDALGESREVNVEVVVENGEITSYTAPYPAFAPQPLQGATHSVSSHPSPTAPWLPPAALLLASVVALPAGVILVMCAGRAISHTPRRRARR